MCVCVCMERETERAVSRGQSKAMHFRLSQGPPLEVRRSYWLGDLLGKRLLNLRPSTPSHIRETHRNGYYLLMHFGGNIMPLHIQDNLGMGETEAEFKPRIKEGSELPTGCMPDALFSVVGEVSPSPRTVRN